MGAELKGLAHGIPGRRNAGVWWANAAWAKNHEIAGSGSLHASVAAIEVGALRRRRTATPDRNAWRPVDVPAVQATSAPGPFRVPRTGGACAARENRYAAAERPGPSSS